MPSRRARALGVVTLGALLLSGCSVQPGAAAVVEGRTIDQSEVERTQRDLALFSPGADPAALLSAIIVAPLFVRAAADNGVAVSEAQARAVIDNEAQALGLTPAPQYGEGLVQVVRSSLAAQSLQSLENGEEVLAGIGEEIAELDVRVSPRYGTFDPAAGRVVPEPLPWIVPVLE